MKGAGSKRVLYFSPVPSHPTSHGNRATIFHFGKLFQQLGHKVHFVVLKSGQFAGEDLVEMRRAWDSVDVVPFRNPMVACGEQIRFDGWYEEELGERVAALCELYEIDVLFCSYVFQSKMLERAAPGVLKVIDTHDRMADRYEMLRKKGLPLEFFSCSIEDEAAYLRRADVVVARREEEALYFDEITGRKSAIVIPHLEPPSPQRRSYWGVTTVGLVASANLINLGIVRDCLAAIDKRLDGAPCPFLLRVAGEVRDMVELLPLEDRELFQRPWVVLEGFVRDLGEFYASVDIVLSPVTIGTGINVKTVQAMAHGVPLLSTRHGSKGVATGDPAHEHEGVSSLVEQLFGICDRPEELYRLAGLSRRRYAELYEEGMDAIRGLFDHPKLWG